MSNDWKPDRGGGSVRFLGGGRRVTVSPNTLDAFETKRYRWYLLEADGGQSATGDRDFSTAGEAIADCERVLVGKGMLPQPEMSPQERDAAWFEREADLMRGLDEHSRAVAARFLRAAAAIRGGSVDA